MVWQALHLAATAACRGIIATNSKPLDNVVVNRERKGSKTCSQLCVDTYYFTQCDAEVSIIGYNGKATENGEVVGMFNNHECDSSNDKPPGQNEASGKDDDLVQGYGGTFSFCCCHMP